MLSQIEMEFLKAPERFNANYRKALRHRIRGKVQALQAELGLLESAGFMKVMADCNAVTDFHNPEQSLNQAAFKDSRLNWSLGRDLDPRPPPYQGDAPPG